MLRLRWPDSTNSVSDVPGTVHCGAEGEPEPRGRTRAAKALRAVMDKLERS